MRAGGDDAAHLEAARLMLVDEEEDQCNRCCLPEPLLSAALFMRGSIRVDTMSSRRFLPSGSFASTWSFGSQTR